MPKEKSDPLAPKFNLPLPKKTKKKAPKEVAAKAPVKPQKRVSVKHPDVYTLLVASYPSLGKSIVSLTSKDIDSINLKVSAHRGYLIVETRTINSVSSFSTNNLSDMNALIDGLKQARRIIKKGNASG